MEEYSRVQLLLFIPWRDEDKLMAEFPTYADRYLSLEKEIELSRSFYHKTAQKVLDTALEEFEEEINLAPNFVLNFLKCIE